MNTVQQHPAAFVIILNYNGWKDTVDCLESLYRTDYPNYKVVLVDNGSTNDSCKFIKDWAQRNEIPYVEYSRDVAHQGGKVEEENGHADRLSAVVRHPLVIIQTGANLGFAKGNNVGIRYALAQGAAYIWLLNNDTAVASSTLGELLITAECAPRVGAVGSVLYDMADPQRVQAWGGGRVDCWLGRSVNHTAPIDRDKLHYLNGASILFSRVALDDVGLLDEGFFMYWEDADLGFRLRARGWTLEVAPAARVLHKESASLGKRSAALDQYFNASAVRFFKRHSVVPGVPICLGVGIRLLKRLLLGDWARAHAVWKGALQ